MFKKISVVRALAGVLVATHAISMPLTVYAQSADKSYPNKPLKWIVPFPPGGPTDSFSRPAAAKLSELLKQPIIVENVPGAGASIGMEKLARSAPDGYTIGLAAAGALSFPAPCGTRPEARA